MPKNKLLLIDGNSVAFRAFYAIQNFEAFKTKSGLHTNAILFFNNMLDNLMEKEKPSHVLIAFDAGKTTFRHAFFDDYKAGRSKTPGEFKEQMPYIRELIEAFGIKHYELADYEADDIIGTMTRLADPEEFEVVVVSGDKDLTQLATDNIRVEVTAKGVSELITYTPAFIKEKYGLEPLQIIDMKGLAGDNSDNIPGVTRVGEKTAIKLLTEYGSVEGVYEHIDELKPSKMKENLINDKEQALMSKRLATIDVASPITITVEELAYSGKDLDKLVPFYREMEFRQQLNKLDVSEMEDNGAPLAEVVYEVVTEVTPEMFGPKMSLYIELLEKNYHTADVQGVAWGTEEKIYVSASDEVLHQPLFKAWLMNDQQEKIVYDAKSNLVTLNRYDILLTNVSFDVLLAAYVLDTNDNSEDLAEVAFNHDYYEIDTDESIYGKGAKKGLPEEEEVFTKHLARKAKALLSLQPLLDAALVEKEQKDLFYEMELPLSFVLGEMEIEGITVNAQRLQEMKQEFAVQLQGIEERIYEQAGEEFNINSPKQLGVILFEKMGLPVIKKTKTGYSTAVDVLEQLKSQAPIIEDILEYRTIAKIQSTYVEGLLKVIQPDGKIHTRYVQTLTQTGRVISVDPKLQKITVRVEECSKIRQPIFPREKEWQIFASDYSQIELRVLADIANDQHMREAFIEGQDIHASTAMRVFGVASEEEVTSNIRRQAKAVNFGIVYGISDYGLSQNLGITRKEAQEFIDKYFDKYPDIKTYMEEIVREAKDKGYVETLWHRRRYLPDINARNFNIRSFAERTAINTPIQGSAADILKIAMINMSKRLKEEEMEATMLLQVHDELVFEAPKSEIPKLEQVVREVMENAVKLSVPLKADSSYGDSWYDAK
ncbi:DNA polymerase I [Vagococcus salmoninarum]|uniref:DNA polymerase I n=1 Tax=Vagococcus salmoninarum TaxID=2739 RepID=UPI0028D3B4E2|nr:DNA polymerase I [Vagococcus salmoninarum]